MLVEGKAAGKKEWLLTSVAWSRLKLPLYFIFTAAPVRHLKGFIKDALLSFVPLKAKQP